MVKYKCPKCGTLYDDVPVVCVTCGAEFLPAEEQDKPKQQPQEAAPAVEAASVAAPVVEEAIKEEPKEEPKVEEVKEAPAPVEEKAEQPEEKQELGYDEASEMTVNAEKGHIPARVIVAFILAFVTIAVYAFNDYLPYFTAIEPGTRVYIGMGMAFATFALAITTMVLSRHPERFDNGRKMAVAARVLGTIFLVFSIINLLLWGAIGTLYIGSDTFANAMGINWKATIDTFFRTGEFLIVKVK